MADNATTLFYSYRRFMLDTYGAPLHRVPVDFGFGCPHRAPDGSGGCTFCPPDGGRAPHTRAAGSLTEQVRAGVEFARGRYGATKFMAYVQAFTGTWAPAERQRELFTELLGLFPFNALSIGTRPDCLPPATLDLLGELRRRVETWVELGVQTVHDNTLTRIRRGHGWEVSRRAIADLDARGLRVVAHVILGLPGETPAHFSATADTLAGLPLSGIKIHNLHVVRGAPLARDYVERPFTVYDEPAYAAILTDFLRRLPPCLPILRVTTDTPDGELLAPRWTLSKGQFLSLLNDALRRQGARQGDRFAGGRSAP